MKSLRLAPAFILALAACFTAPAQAWNRLEAETFAVLPEGSGPPEGITADADGNIYAADFAVGQPGPGKVQVFAPNGKLLRELAVAGSSGQLLGIAFRPDQEDLLVIDFGAQQVLRVDPISGASTLFATIPGGTSAGPNALAFDAARNVYISDSFQGVVWRTGPTGGAPTAFIEDALLRTAGVPPFGANGLGFKRDGSSLFVANTGNDTVVRVPVANGVAGTPEVFVNSINGADGLMVDEADNLWVAANQADEIVVLDPTGRVIAKLGDFDGLTRDGAPIGLLFPASTVQSGQFVYVANLALDLRGFGLAQTPDSQWAAEVKRFTIARIKFRIPPVCGLPGPTGKPGCGDN